MPEAPVIDGETSGDGPEGRGVQAVIAALKAAYQERVSTAHAVREQHANTVTWSKPKLPDAVLFAENTGDVRHAVSLCAAHAVPIVPFGAGSSLEGHVNATRGGISIDTSRMNAIRAVYPEDLCCVVEAGVTRKQLNTYLRDTGLFFPIDPGADASIGGMTATRASGTNAVRYGTMRDNVMAVKAVMPDGTVIDTGQRARKSSAGYDLTHLMVGSEGTLGVMTEITLKLYGIPETIAGGICPFETLEGACDSVIATIQSGVPIARIELLDDAQVRAVNAYSKLELAEKPTLLVEFHGSCAHVEEQASTFGAIAEEFGGGPFHWVTDTEGRNRLWQARHDAYWAARALKPGTDACATDVCVPISRLAECVAKTKTDLAALDLTGPIVGHVGDGNFHVTVLIDMTDEEEVARAQRFSERLVARALEMDGTSTGEHGIGEGKMAFLEAEFGPAIEVMRALKRAIDPHNIMNPGKIVAV